jgi:protein-disulfide isomerase
MSLLFRAPKKAKTPLGFEKSNKFWMASTLVLVFLFGGYLVYEYQPQAHQFVANTLGIAPDKGPQPSGPVFELPFTVVYNSKDPQQKEKISNFIKSLEDPEKGLKLTKINAEWVDYTAAKGQEYVKESASNFLPIAFFGKEITNHPQYTGIKNYLNQKGDHFYFSLGPLQHLKTPEITGAHFKGADPGKAEVVILEYGSFTCHFCKEMEEVLTKIMTDFPDKIALVYKYYDRNGTDVLLAQGAECANDQKKFWEMHDLLYQDQGNFISFMQKFQESPENGVREYLGEKAKTLQLNSKNFLQCYDSKKYQRVSQDQTTEGMNFGLRGTPAFFINGKFYDGAYKYETFKSFIEESLKNKNS